MSHREPVRASQFQLDGEDAVLPVERTAVSTVGERTGLDILPALKREDSFVGRRAVPAIAEGNFLPDGSTGFMSTTSGRWAHEDASPFGLPRLWLRT